MLESTEEADRVAAWLVVAGLDRLERRSLALKKDNPRAVILLLSTDEHMPVRRRVAENETTPVDILISMLSDEAYEVVESVENNKNFVRSEYYFKKYHAAARVSYQKFWEILDAFYDVSFYSLAFNDKFTKFWTVGFNDPYEGYEGRKYVVTKDFIAWSLSELFDFIAEMNSELDEFEKTL